MGPISLRASSPSRPALMDWRFLLVAMAIFSAVMTVYSLARHLKPKAPGLRDVCARLRSAGFHCVVDASTESDMTGFMVSRSAVSREEVALLCKARPLGAQWEGKVWVTVNSPMFAAQTVPDGSAPRFWINVIAYGDESLLEEIDGLVGSP